MKVTKINAGVNPSFLLATVSLTNNQIGSVEVQIDSGDRLLSEIKADAIAKAKELLKDVLESEGE